MNEFEKHLQAASESAGVVERERRVIHYWREITKLDHESRGLDAKDRRSYTTIPLLNPDDEPLRHEALIRFMRRWQPDPPEPPRIVRPS